MVPITYQLPTVVLFWHPSVNIGRNGMTMAEFDSAFRTSRFIVRSTFFIKKR